MRTDWDRARCRREGSARAAVRTSPSSSSVRTERATCCGAHRRLASDLVETLVEIHSADVNVPGLRAFVRPGNYNERQVRRFSQLWELNQTRDLPTVERVGRWLAANVPEQLSPTVVHGDYRLGNTIVTPEQPERIAAVLDWEMGAIGDP